MRGVPLSVAIMVTVTVGRWSSSALAAAEQSTALPSLDPFMRLQHYAPQWAVDADGATSYVFTAGGPSLPDRPGHPIHQVVAFPPTEQGLFTNPLWTLMAGAPMAWIALLFNGGEDLASATDAELYAQRFGWDTTEAGLIQCAGRSAIAAPSWSGCWRSACAVTTA